MAYVHRSSPPRSLLLHVFDVAISFTSIDYGRVRKHETYDSAVQKMAILFMERQNDPRRPDPVIIFVGRKKRIKLFGTQKKS